MKKKLIILILGPTCVGKTLLSIFLAKKLNTEILSIDSRQFYRELKIGSGMPTKTELNTIPHHFIGHLCLHKNYNAKLFEVDFYKKISNLFIKYSVLIAVGGSSLYEKSITVGLSEIPKIDTTIIKKDLIFNFKKFGIEFLQKEFEKIRTKNDVIDIKNPRRLIRYLEIFKSTGKNPSFFFKKKIKERFFKILKIGIYLSKKEHFIRIDNRVNNMIKQGIIDEAIRFYHFRHLNSLQTIGYKELFSFFSKKKEYINLQFTIEKIKINTRKYVKKQITWYKKSNDIKWFYTENKNEILDFILKKIEKWAILDLNQ
ncbi:tRNA (adenosine(37)-N6)-dimethylallyltransferase MiaA [Blattabacterium cuenoti]|uniref:tRNA (adenosine(37)-N6)-dimethylallyltransferase MiaA n=1 Tax=Blattabacterium cuenoti TaxID=1653831 RepID=UPI001EEB6F15|nr:tRNA (adenosine(37)-N6)-dimethylallyltransferase MiaA [Blattabacterium cuenoti]